MPWGTGNGLPGRKEDVAVVAHARLSPQRSDVCCLCYEYTTLALGVKAGLFGRIPNSWLNAFHSQGRNPDFFGSGIFFAKRMKGEKHSEILMGSIEVNKYLTNLSVIKESGNIFVYGTSSDSMDLFCDLSINFGIHPLGFMSEDTFGTLLDMPVVSMHRLTNEFLSNIKLLVPYPGDLSLDTYFNNRNIKEYYYVCKDSPCISDIDDVYNSVSALNTYSNPIAVDNKRQAQAGRAKKKSCAVLNEGMWVDFEGAKTCCFMPTIVKISNFQFMYQKILNMRNEIYTRIDGGEDTFCSNCAHMKEETGRNYARYFKKIGLGFTWQCNFRCKYCTTNKTKPQIDSSIVESVVSELIRSKALRSDSTFTWAGGGEPVLAPYFNSINDKLLDLGCAGRVYSNGSIYSKSIETGLKRKQFVLVTSVDAGSRETFFKIKNNDCFNMVINNILMYVSAAGPENIYVKYIVTDDNSSECEFESFLDILENMNVANVILSRDFNTANEIDKINITSMMSIAQARGFSLDSPPWV